MSGRVFVYLCVNGAINFDSFYDFSIRFWNCSDSLIVLFVLHFMSKPNFSMTSVCILNILVRLIQIYTVYQGRIQDFQLGGGGGALKKIAPSGGKREIFGVFRVKNHDFTPKNHIFSNYRGGGGAPGAPPAGSAPVYRSVCYHFNKNNYPPLFIEVPVPEKSVVVYLCLKVIDIVFFYNFPIGYLNCSSSVVIFVLFYILFQ